MGVRAVGKVAQGDKRPELDEKPLDLLGDQVPESQLANAGRVDALASAVEFDQLGASGDMASLSGG